VIHEQLPSVKVSPASLNIGVDRWRVNDVEAPPLAFFRYPLLSAPSVLKLMGQTRTRLAKM
jgi:hypothetical protein